MIFMAIILVAAVIPVLWAFLMPVDIVVNTDHGLYKVSQAGTVSVSFHPGEKETLRLRVLGFRVITARRPGSRKETSQKARRSGPRFVRTWDAWRTLVTRIGKGVRCRRLICDVDLGDVVWNAQLFPVARLVSHGPVVWRINFEQRYRLDLWVQVRIYRMLWSFIRFYFTKS